MNCASPQFVTLCEEQRLGGGGGLTQMKGDDCVGVMLAERATEQRPLLLLGMWLNI